MQEGLRLALPGDQAGPAQEILHARERSRVLIGRHPPTLTALLPKPQTGVKPLDLRIGSIRSYMTPEEFRALSDPPDEANTVIVTADAPLLPMKSELDVPGGILAPFWALAHPTKAWRIFLPDARVKEIPPPENKIPPREFRWGP